MSLYYLGAFGLVCLLGAGILSHWKRNGAAFTWAIIGVLASHFFVLLWIAGKSVK